MLDPVSALATFGAFKKLTFETIWSSLASVLASVGIVGSYNGGTTISACERIAIYLGFSPHWTQLSQSWATNHAPLVFTCGIFLLLVCLSLFGSNNNGFRTASTTAWGIAVLLSVKTYDHSSILIIFLVLVVAIFLGHKQSAQFGASFFITAFFYWIVSLWVLLSGSGEIVSRDTNDK